MTTRAPHRRTHRAIRRPAPAATDAREHREGRPQARCEPVEAGAGAVLLAVITAVCALGLAPVLQRAAETFAALTTASGWAW